MSNSTARKSNSGSAQNSRGNSRFLVLEPRYVFDAALGAELFHHSDPVDLTLTADHDAVSVSNREVAAAATALMQSGETVADRAIAERSLSGLVAIHNQAGTQKEIAFIDSRLADIETLINDIPSNVRIVLIDPSRDGVAQMADALKGESGISAVHILSHGSAGHIDLGTSVIDEHSMSTIYKPALASIGANLSPDADILVYGCDFGDGAAGSRAASVLGQLTGADIAASINVTGGATDADWNSRTGDGRD